MRSEVIVVTPEMAKVWLENNHVNRSISQYRVDGYARDMLNGNWVLNGEAIKIGKLGDLKDGQHRLSAIVKAGVPVATLVVFDVDDSANVFDRGRTRSVRDSLVIAGFPDYLTSNSNIATAKLGLYVQKERYSTDGDVGKFLRDNEYAFSQISGLFYVSSNGRAHGARINVLKAAIVLAMLYAFNSGISAETIKRFLEIVKVGLYNGEPESSAAVFRNDIISNGSNGVKDQLSLLGMAEKAILDFSEGRPRKISYRQFADKVSLPADPRYGKEKTNAGE